MSRTCYSCKSPLPGGLTNDNLHNTAAIMDRVISKTPITPNLAALHAFSAALR